jgi:hypothetical protein
MVEQVERLAPELQRYPLLDLRVLGDCEVDIRKSGTGENVSAGIAVPGGLAEQPVERHRGEGQPGHAGNHGGEEQHGDAFAAAICRSRHDGPSLRSSGRA